MMTMNGNSDTRKTLYAPQKQDHKNLGTKIGGKNGARRRNHPDSHKKSPNNGLLNFLKIKLIS
jgi:hypothetical protein